jgi:hypothetical protein
MQYTHCCATGSPACGRGLAEGLATECRWPIDDDMGVGVGVYRKPSLPVDLLHVLLTKHGQT